MTKKLGGVCEIIYGYPFDSKLFNNNQKGKPVIRIRDVVRGFSETFTTEPCDSKYWISKDDVLIGMDGDFNISTWKSSRALLNQRVCKLESGEKITNLYLRYILPTKLQGIWDKKLFTTVKHLSAKDLNSISISIPPLAEQKRIVEKVDAAFEKIDKLKANAERNLANAKELFQSALDEAMRPKDGWVEKRLGEVCTGKLSYGTSSPSRVYDARVRYIRITDIDDNGRLLNDLVSPKEYDAKHVLKDGDLVFARTGATVGKSYMYSLSDGVCVYAGYLIRARVDESIIRPKYLFYFTKTSRYKLFIQQSQAAAAQPNVNAEKYSNMLVPIPPVHEQDEIMSCIGKIQELSIQLQQNYNRQIADCVEMRQAVLREAFEGRL